MTRWRRRWKQHWVFAVFVLTVLSLVHRRRDQASFTTISPSISLLAPSYHHDTDTGSTSTVIILAEEQRATEASSSPLSSSSHLTSGTNCSSWKGPHEVLVRPTVYVCGFDLWNFAQNLFPDFDYGGRLTHVHDSLSQDGTTNWCAQDVLVQGGLDGPCDVPQIVIHETFPGKILFVNSEARKGTKAAEKHRLSDRFYQIGPSEEEHPPAAGGGDETTLLKTKRTLSVYFGAIFWSATTTPEQRGFFLKESRVEATMSHKDEMAVEQQQRHEGRKQAVIFMVSNCLKERREAATLISTILRLIMARNAVPYPTTNTTRLFHSKNIKAEDPTFIIISCIRSTNFVWSWKIQRQKDI